MSLKLAVLVRLAGEKVSGSLGLYNISAPITALGL